MEKYHEYRKLLKSNFDEFKATDTDKARGVTKPEEVKGCIEGGILIDLPEVSENTLSNNNLFKCIKERRSVRLYSEEAITLEELSYLLWATQGIVGKNNGGLTLRTVPCSGATHTFETYLFVTNVDGLKKGAYRYLPIEHKLLLMFEMDGIDKRVDELTLEQPFVPNFAKKAAVTFAWSTTPYRSEWKFGITAHKKILIDVGHICQNLYLASESIGAGTCAIGIYDQRAIDTLLHLDGENEFVIYLAAVGRKREK